MNTKDKKIISVRTKPQSQYISSLITCISSTDDNLQSIISSAVAVNMIKRTDTSATVWVKPFADWTEVLFSFASVTPGSVYARLMQQAWVGFLAFVHICRQ